MKKKDSTAYLLITVMLLSVVMVADPATADTVSLSVRPGPLLAMPESSPLEINVVGPRENRVLLLGGIPVRDGRGNGKGWRVTAAMNGGRVTSIGSAGPGDGLGTHVVAGRLRARSSPNLLEITIQSE